MNNFTNKQEIKKEVGIVLLMTFTITFIMGIFMYIAYVKDIKKALEGFVLLQMFYPAASVMIYKMYYKKEEVNQNLRSFYNFFLILTVILIITQLLGTAFFADAVIELEYLICAIASIVGLFKVKDNKENAFSSINLSFDFNKKTCAFILLIFYLLNLLIMFIGGYLENDISSLTNIKSITIMLCMPLILLISFFLSWIMFFGEEFAWRGFFQERLQILFGKKLGVIILGLIWGIWHFPLIIMIYTPATPWLGVLNYVIFCPLSAIFLGFAYMKTKNVWVPILVHMLNNSLPAITGVAYNKVVTPKDLLICSIMLAIIYLPFLFTKEYKENSESFSESL